MNDMPVAYWLLTSVSTETNGRDFRHAQVVLRGSRSLLH